ncbi:superoxide dismutase [Actinomadura sp. KC345]|uniref:SMP-30/gluconolactonase/LRE family protein n=1 Tax=Actinomadura sp. KC345 TaxID=2530371 RepID=UPI001042C762|nr:superoxide dismutase [Actinomadura sp. KC345]TDC44220.1 superoxide dismutase [Actinomadura sp. KC345]
MWSRLIVPALAVGLLVPGGSAHGGTGHGRPVDRMGLPDGFQPEGIATGPGPVAFFGSRATGAIYRADLRTGKGKVISAGPGTPSLGMKTRGHRLFVAGGTGGDARVVDTRSGRVLTSYALTRKPSFVNDVVLTRSGAWFTDSTNPVLYRVPIDGRGRAKTLALSGDIEFGDGINANGIVALPGGRSLLVVQSNTGKLFKVDAGSGVAEEVDLRGESLANGDGLLLEGRTLYTVQNRLNVVAVVRLNGHATEGRVVERLTDPRFDVPTTVARFGPTLYLPNARFNTPPTPSTHYDAIGIHR